jgi:hypothetical protein
MCIKFISVVFFNNVQFSVGRHRISIPIFTFLQLLLPSDKLWGHEPGRSPLLLRGLPDGRPGPGELALGLPGERGQGGDRLDLQVVLKGIAKMLAVFSYVNPNVKTLKDIQSDNLTTLDRPGEGCGWVLGGGGRSVQGGERLPRGPRGGHGGRAGYQGVWVTRS